MDRKVPEHSPNGGPGLAILLCSMTVVKSCWHNFTQSAYFMISGVDYDHHNCLSLPICFYISQALFYVISHVLQQKKIPLRRLKARISIWPIPHDSLADSSKF